MRNTKLLELMHGDLCDANQPSIRVENKYLLTFIIDHSKYCYIYLIKTKDGVFEKLK